MIHLATCRGSQLSRVIANTFNTNCHVMYEVSKYDLKSAILRMYTTNVNTDETIIFQFGLLIYSYNHYKYKCVYYYLRVNIK